MDGFLVLLLGVWKRRLGRTRVEKIEKSRLGERKAVSSGAFSTRSTDFSHDIEGKIRYHSFILHLIYNNVSIKQMPLRRLRPLLDKLKKSGVVGSNNWGRRLRPRLVKLDGHVAIKIKTT